MKGRASNTYHVDRLIDRMWEVRDRLKANFDDGALWQQWIFIRRVLARAIAQAPGTRPPSR